MSLRPKVALQINVTMLDTRPASCHKAVTLVWFDNGIDVLSIVGIVSISFPTTVQTHDISEIRIGNLISRLFGLDGLLPRNTQSERYFAPQTSHQRVHRQPLRFFRSPVLSDVPGFHQFAITDGSGHENPIRILLRLLHRRFLQYLGYFGGLSSGVSTQPLLIQNPIRAPILQATGGDRTRN